MLLSNYFLGCSKLTWGKGSTLLQVCFLAGRFWQNGPHCGMDCQMGNLYRAAYSVCPQVPEEAPVVCSSDPVTQPCNTVPSIPERTEEQSGNCFSLQALLQSPPHRDHSATCKYGNQKCTHSSLLMQNVIVYW